MNPIFAFLNGKKTYISAGLLALVSLLNLITGDISLTNFLQDPNLLTLIGAFGIAGIGHKFDKADAAAKDSTVATEEKID